MMAISGDWRMNNSIVVAGVGMTRFAKHLDRSLKSLALEAIAQALGDANVSAGSIQAAYIGNAAAGVMTGQACVLGEIVLREMGIGRIPVINVENACASASTAFQQAFMMLSAGFYDVALAVGVEKLTHPDKQRTFSVFQGSVDVEDHEGLVRYLAELAGAESTHTADPASGGRSIFMDIYAARALQHMRRFGTTQRQFAMVASKNAYHGSLNSRAQYRDPLSVDEVLAASPIVYPLTLPMCSPIGDGAAAAILMTEKKAKELGLSSSPTILASILTSGWDRSEDDGNDVAAYASALAYEAASVGPDDLDVVELHDASAPAELILYESLGLAKPGEGSRLLEEGATSLGGRLPVNTSGGLLRKGHPIGATGIAQIFELVTQLRGNAGNRQASRHRTALAQNGGGMVRGTTAACVVTILQSG